jgi:phasin family protein
MSAFEFQGFISLYQLSIANLFALANPTIQGFQAVVELNVQAVKATISEGKDNLNHTVSGKSPAEFLARQSYVTQQIAEKVAMYGRQLCEIASSTQAEFAKVAHAQYEQHSDHVQTLAENFMKSAPIGSGAAIIALKTAFSTANTTTDAVREAAKQAIETARRNFAATAPAVQKTGQQAAAQLARIAKL